MLKDDPTKIADFRARVSSYRSSAITATHLIEVFFTLFDASASDLGKLVKELANLYESEALRSALLEAWNDWRAINEDYPSLPGLATTSSAPPASSGRRILKLKSSTAQSSRSPANRQNSWGAAAPSHPFPSIASASVSNSGRTGSARVGSTPWTSTSSSRPSPSPSRPGPTAPVAAVNRVGTDAFPALPTAARPNTNIFGLHRGSVKWDDRSAAPLNPWGGSGIGARTTGSPSTSNEPSGAEEDPGGSGGVGGKKKGKKKGQTLLIYG